MRHEPADGHVAFARLGELGPVLGDGGVEVEPAFLGESVGAEGGQPLGRGEDVDERVAVPLALMVGVVPAAPEVDDGLAVEVDGDGGADLSVLGEVCREGFADRVESWFGPSADWGVGHW